MWVWVPPEAANFSLKNDCFGRVMLCFNCVAVVALPFSAFLGVIAHVHKYAWHLYMIVGWRPDAWLSLTLLLHHLTLQGSDRSACIWDSRSGQCTMRFEGHENDVNAVRFFPTGEAIATACSDGTVSIIEGSSAAFVLNFLIAILLHVSLFVCVFVCLCIDSSLWLASWSGIEILYQTRHYLWMLCSGLLQKWWALIISWHYIYIYIHTWKKTYLVGPDKLYSDPMYMLLSNNLVMQCFTRNLLAYSGIQQQLVVHWLIDIWLCIWYLFRSCIVWWLWRLCHSSLGRS